jgi:hypothetical protein
MAKPSLIYFRELASYTKELVCTREITARQLVAPTHDQ